MTQTDTAPAGRDRNAVATPQQMGLSLLLAEMTALSALIPGLPAATPRSDAERESDFDNMPV